MGKIISRVRERQEAAAKLEGLHRIEWEKIEQADDGIGSFMCWSPIAFVLALIYLACLAWWRWA